MSLTEASGTPACPPDPGARRRHAQPRDGALWDGAPGSCDSAHLHSGDSAHLHSGDSAHLHSCDSAHLHSGDSALLFGRSWGSEVDSINSCHGGHGGHGGHVCGDLDDDEPQRKRTILAENQVEANKVVNNYRFGFRKWKSHVTERPFEGRSEVVKELYSELNQVKTPEGGLLTCGNVFYVLVFGWFLSLVYLLVSALMFLTVIGFNYGKLCFRLSCYFLWPFGKPVHQVGKTLRRCCSDVPHCGCSSAQSDSSTLLPSPLEDPEEAEGDRVEPPGPERTSLWYRPSTYLWLLLGLPPLALVHFLVCFLSWILVFTVPVSKMSARTLTVILLLPPEDVHVSSCCRNKNVDSESKALLCCYSATNWFYYKYTVDGINIFAVNLLPLVVVAIVMGYVDPKNRFSSSEVKFAVAVVSIVPLSYYIGMGIASVSAQSNFAVGAVVNATFGSITELTFYITALLRGHRHGNACLQEVVKSALTGTLLGCILFIPGVCMVIGGLRHSEQRFNCRSTAVSSALLFISVGGVFTPTLFSKAYSSLTCESCSSSNHSSGPFVCTNCHLDMNNGTLFQNHVQPLVYTMSALLPSAYVIGLLFTLKTHRHIYNIQTDSGQTGQTGQTGPSAPSTQRAVVHWSRWRSLLTLIVGTVLMSACADLATEHIQPILSQPNVSQFFIGVTVIAMVPEIPEIITGIQFALQNNISLSLEVGSCIAVQVCMIQIPLLVFFNAFWDVGFVLLFSDLHLWSSIFSVVLVNYIFMDGKCDYFQGTALVVVYLILLALYYFAPSPKGC